MSRDAVGKPLVAATGTVGCVVWPCAVAQAWDDGSWKVPALTMCVV